MRKEVIEAQIVLGTGDVKEELGDFIRRNAWKKIFLVAGKSFDTLPLGEEFWTLTEELKLEVERFSAFSVNPLFQEAVEGARAFRDFSADVIFAVGGGSAMDTAKCIKLFSSISEKELLKTPWKDNGVPLLAVPTTAGTGSESTPFAVLYKDGEKISVEDESIYPLIRVEDARSLRTLPLFQKKACLLDALSHAMESIWSKASEGDNLYYGKEAIERILRYSDAYLEGEEEALKEIAYAANLAGKAIAITKTTGGHALSYKLGSLFRLPHGLATAMVNKELYPISVSHLRPEEEENFRSLAHCLRAKDIEGGVVAYRAFLDKMDILPKETRFFLENLDKKVLEEGIRKMEKEGTLPKDLQTEIPEAEEVLLEKAVVLLVHSVNQERMKNHPVTLSEKELDTLYRKILLM